MSGSIRTLQPALHRTQIKLDSLPSGAVVLDRFEDAWQSSGRPGGASYYWYRAYGDSTEVSSFELAQRGPVKVLGVVA